MEARLTARRGENLLAMVAIPLAVLGYFATFGSAPGSAGGSGSPVSALLPGALSLAIVASGLVNLGIATAYERGYGVLKRLGGAPLGRSGLLTAKLLVVLALAAVQVVGLLLFARLALAWAPATDVAWLGVVLATVMGSLAFAGIGLLLAGYLRPEATLVVANALFLAAILFGGALPFVTVTGRADDALSWLPPGALTAAFATAFAGGTDLVRPLAVLGIWAVAAFAVAARTFRWE
jgi:ABC-2 type transport system permease protein